LVGIRRTVVIEATRVGADGSNGAFSDLQIWVRGYLRADVKLARANQVAYTEGIIP
jgi:hypothetical protein